MSALEARVERVPASFDQKSWSLSAAPLALLAFAAMTMAFGVSGCGSDSDAEPEHECSAEQPCPTGQFCNAHHVCENETGGGCSEDDPCPTGQFCNEDDVCENETGADCSDDVPCPTGQICNANNVCENEPVFGDDKPRLYELEAEPEGPNCRWGGQLLLSGLDLNQNEAVDASEVDAQQYNCFPSPYSSNLRFLLDIEDVEPGSQCTDGGILVHSGYDADASEALEESERESSVLLCHTADCEGSMPLLTRSIVFESDPFDIYDDARTYELSIDLSRAADPSTLRVDQFNEGLAPDPDFDWSIDASDDHTLLIDAHPSIVGDTHVVVSDACGFASASLFVPFGTTEAPVLRVFAGGVPVVGEEVAVCWESRYLSDCSMNVGTSTNPNIVSLPDVQGCHDVTVLPEHVVNDYIFTGVSVTCEDSNGNDSTRFVSTGVVPDIYEFSTVGTLSLPSSGGQVNFRITTQQMESCTLITSMGDIPVPPNTLRTSVWFTESSQVRFVCKDTGGTEYEQTGVHTFVRVGPGITSVGVNSPLDEGGFTKLNTTVVVDYVENGSCDLTFHYEGNTVHVEDEPLVPAFDTESVIQIDEVYNEFPYVAGGEGRLEGTCTGDNGFEQSFAIAFF